jgi:transcriptional antiterminator NusG
MSPWVPIEVGDQVRVLEGPFTSFNGAEVDEDRSRPEIAISIFGHAAPVELEFDRVEKLHGVRVSSL